MKNYYQILGVSPYASTKKIKKARKKLAFQYHPDRHANTEYTVRQMQEINEAYVVLSNTSKRTDYDIKRKTYSPNFQATSSTTYSTNHTKKDIFETGQQTETDTKINADDSLTHLTLKALLLFVSFIFFIVMVSSPWNLTTKSDKDKKYHKALSAYLDHDYRQADKLLTNLWDDEMTDKAQIL